MKQSTESVKQRKGERGLAALRLLHQQRRETREQTKQEALLRASHLGAAKDHVDLEYVEIAKIRRESLFNRDLDHDRALSYAMSFSWTLFGSVILNQWSDKSYECIDGQHRIVAADLVFGSTCRVPAVVNHLTHIAQAADAFDGINSKRVGLNFPSKLRGRLVAGKADAVQLVAVLAEFGLKPAMTTREMKSPQPGTVVALSTLNRQMSRGGPSLPRAILSLIAAAYGDDPSAYKDYMLEGMGIFLILYHTDKNFREERVVTILSKGLDIISERAKRFQSGMEVRRAHLWAQALHHVYNEDLRAHRQLEPWRAISPQTWKRGSSSFFAIWRTAHQKGEKTPEKGPN